MLTIRFQRVGRKNDPAFRIVVTEKRSKPKSGELEILGSFHPKTKEIRLKNDRILYWLSQGAKASPRVHNLLVTHKVINAPKIAVGKRPKEAATAIKSQPLTPETAAAHKEVPVEVPAEVASG